MAKHFDESGNELRCVYLAEFEADNYCYIGTTNDYDGRISDHLFEDRHSEVFQHKRHTGLIPTFTMLHDYTSIEEADSLEFYHTIEFAKLGKKILNVQKPGGYGHKEYLPANPKIIKGKIDEHSIPYNAEIENKKNNFQSYYYRHKGDYSDSVKKVYDLLVKICIRVSANDCEFICIRKCDFPFEFSFNELDSLISNTKAKNGCKLCNISCIDYLDGNKDLSYITCHNINSTINQDSVLCQYDDKAQFEKLCEEIYQKSFVFVQTNSIKEYIHNKLGDIDNQVRQILLNREITTPFTTKVEVEQFGYREDLACSKIDYALMLKRIGGLFSPSFHVDFDKYWNLSSLCLSISYNSYSIWAKRYDLYEMQDENKQKKFKKLVEKIDNFIYAEKEKIKEYPQRIEFSAKNTGINDIDTLKSFMRHFYVSHGTAWDTGSPDSCICSIKNYNGNNLDDCKFIIDIQGEQFFLFYDLKNHVLDDNNSYFKPRK